MVLDHRVLDGRMSRVACEEPAEVILRDVGEGVCFLAIAGPLRWPVFTADSASARGSSMERC